ncbi:hypothetical protein QR665_11315 [Acinetobacter gerneri]|uniref:cell division protein BlhA n=1 Tax=Acinetobacter gerneri TaxID=202952 RepID=UPI0029353DB1|nr:hypothetical protein [Acinetobacter gerneri]MDV2440055.1 hypothetical protein [Acinetobacter gerneri]
MVALNVGQDFKKRWLDAPEAVRQAFIDDLTRITDLFDHKTRDIQAWLEHDKRSLQVAGLKVEQAYADLKARLIEEARARKQAALEKSLVEKRAKEAEYNQQLLQDEARQYQEQTQVLADIRENVDHEIQEYTAHYHKNPENDAVNAAPFDDSSIRSKLENVRLRLELEAENLIEQAVTVFRAKLLTASQEEIEYILKDLEDKSE